MTQAIHIHAVADTSNPDSDSPAVARCNQAWQTTYDAEMAQSGNKAHAIIYARRAYCNAMPTLSGYEGIRDFIACTAHGLLNSSIESSQGTKLLYAAQVALAALRIQPAPQKQERA